MFLSGIGTAAPSTRWTQLQCWDALVASNHLSTLSPRSQAILRKVLFGICSRHLAFDQLSEAFSFDPPVRLVERTRPEFAPPNSAVNPPV